MIKTHSKNKNNQLGTSTSGSSTKRARMKFVFMLDVVKDTQRKIADMIEDELKPQRLFTDWVRKGLMLMHDLTFGNLDVLTELFPEVVERIERKAIEGYKAGRDDQIEALIAEFKSYMQVGAPVEVPRADADRVPLPPSNMSATKKTTVDDADVGQNLINSFKKLQKGK